MRTLRAARDRCTAAWPAELPAADHDHVLAAAALGVARHGGVVDAGAGEPRDVVGRELAPARAGGDDDRAGERVLPVVEVDADEPLVAARELDRAVEARQHRVEAARLQRRLARQLDAGDPGGEAEVVLDPRAGPGLAARAPTPRSRASAALRSRRRRRPRAPRGRRPSTTRSKRSPSISARRPSSRATCAAEGLRSTDRLRTRTGVSSRGICSQSSIAALSGSVSTSYQRTGMRLRSSRSRTSKARREPRGAMRRAHAVPVGLVPLPARHHRAQDELGELGPGREHRPQLRALEGDDVGRLVGDALGDRRLAREGGDVAEERPARRPRRPRRPCRACGRAPAPGRAR